MYVDNYQNNVYDKEIMILFLTRIELLPIKRSADIRTERPLMTMHCVIIAALHARGGGTF